jgi:hypothetical protein
MGDRSKVGLRGEYALTNASASTQTRASSASARTARRRRWSAIGTKCRSWRIGRSPTSPTLRRTTRISTMSRHDGFWIGDARRRREGRSFGRAREGHADRDVAAGFNSPACASFVRRASRSKDDVGAPYRATVMTLAAHRKSRPKDVQVLRPATRTIAAGWGLTCDCSDAGVVATLGGALPRNNPCAVDAAFPSRKCRSGCDVHQRETQLLLTLHCSQ